MNEIRQKTQSIIDKYEEELTAKGIQITVSKRYFETQVGERMGGTGNQAIFNAIERARDRKKEKEEGYNRQSNRYHCIVLSVLPRDKDTVSREYCKEYAFVLRKVERAHIGLEPRKTTYEESKILAKIEKRILKILEKVERTTVQKVCKDTFCDALRYSASKYSYKRRFLGKERATWELIFLVLTVVLVFAVVFIIWAIGELI